MRIVRGGGEGESKSCHVPGDKVKLSRKIDVKKIDGRRIAGKN